MDHAVLVSQASNGRRPDAENLAEGLSVEHSRNAVEAAARFFFGAICELQLIRAERTDDAR